MWLFNFFKHHLIQYFESDQSSWEYVLPILNFGEGHLVKKKVKKKKKASV